MHGHTYDTCRKKRNQAAFPPASTQSNQPAKANDEAAKGKEDVNTNEKGKEVESVAVSSQNVAPVQHSSEAWKTVEIRKNNKNKQSGPYQTKDQQTTQSQSAPQPSQVWAKKVQPSSLNTTHNQQSSQPQKTNKGSAQTSLGERILKDKSAANPRGANHLDTSSKVKSFHYGSHKHNIIPPSFDMPIVMQSEVSGDSQMKILSQDDEYSLNKMSLDPKSMVSKDDFQFSPIAIAEVEDIYNDFMHLHAVEKQKAEARRKEKAKSERHKMQLAWTKTMQSKPINLDSIGFKPIRGNIVAQDQPLVSSNSFAVLGELEGDDGLNDSLDPPEAGDTVVCLRPTSYRPTASKIDDAVHSKVGIQSLEDQHSDEEDITQTERWKEHENLRRQSVNNNLLPLSDQ